MAEMLAEFAAAVRRDDVVIQHFRDDIRSRIIDLLGNCLAASSTDIFAVSSSVLRGWGGKPAASAIGLASGYPASSAALHNGTLAHALDFDDTHLPSVLHPSASVIPAVMATGEALGIDADGLVSAALVGLEVTNRLGMAGYDDALGNSVYFERGLHATSICGTVGSAVAVAMLRNAGPAEIAHAIGIAASMGAGLLEANRTGGTVKKIHCGWAAHAGTVAAELASAGLTGPPTVLEGRFGFLQAHCGDRVDLSALINDLGVSWTIPAIGYKPYPCNVYTHPIIDAALRMRVLGVDANDIDRVDVGVAAPTLRTIAEPAETKARPASGYQAQFSGPYAFATAMLGEGGGLGVSLRDFTDAAAADPRRQALAARVSLAADAECTAAFPRRISSNVRYRLMNGSTGSVIIPESRGFGDRQLLHDEQLTKFRANASLALPPRRLRELESALLTLFERPLGQTLSRLRRLPNVHNIRQGKAEDA